jgi:ribose transport system permease protein
MTPMTPTIETGSTEPGAAPAGNGGGAGRKALKDLAQIRPSMIRDYGIIVILLVLFVVLALASGPFLTGTNLLNILQENAPIGVVAVGTTLCFISGGFDLSIGASYAMGGVVAALAVGPLGPVPALIVGVLTGFGLGVMNGIIVTVGRINPFVTTLATSIVVGGVAAVIHGGAPILVNGSTFSVIGANSIFGLRIETIIWIVFSLLCGFILQRTVLGRYIYALGGSEEATRLSGVRVSRVRLVCYGISGLGAALGGVMIASQTNAGVASAGGFSLAVTAVAGVVIGGTSIMGGEGAVWRTVVGILILALIGNGFDLLSVDPNWQAAFQGGLIILAVGADTWARRSN